MILGYVLLTDEGATLAKQPGGCLNEILKLAPRTVKKLGEGRHPQFGWKEWGIFPTELGPLIIYEVNSEDTQANETAKKMHQYLSQGLREL